MLKTRMMAGVFAVLACLMSSTATAQTSDRRTLFTFNQPVTVPGVTLPAGTYLFRIPSVDSSRRVVQVLDAEGMRSYALLLSIPAQRLDPPSTPEIRFMETPSGTPAAIQTWWYPGSTIGYEFIYPKEQALRLARGGTPVLTTTAAQNDTTAEMQQADLARVSSGGSETSVTVQETPTAAAVTGTGQQGEVASASLAVAANPSAGTAATQVARRELPKTASLNPLVAAIGFAMFCSGVWLARTPRI